MKRVSKKEEEKIRPFPEFLITVLLSNSKKLITSFISVRYLINILKSFCITHWVVV